ncbi:MAG: hypothetical protein WBW33_16050 [Bryobacteraceae bacterium]
MTKGVVVGVYSGGEGTFVASLSSDGSVFGFVTYLGGGKNGNLASLAGGPGGILVAGNTYSWHCPTANAVNPCTLLREFRHKATSIRPRPGLPEASPGGGWELPATLVGTACPI